MQTGLPLSLERMAENTPLPRDMTSKFRKGTPRSRDGCVACKARHVKCDETRPRCKKCVAADRKCEYKIPPPKNWMPSLQDNAAVQQGISTAIPYQPIIDISEIYAERRSFHYIQSKSLTETFGRCEIDLWDFTMLSYSHHIPVVRKSLLALASIYEIHESKTLRNDRSPICVGNLHGHAFTQYTQAVSGIIQALRSNANRRNKDRKSVLISCLIFTWVEIMLGNLDTARWHLDSGIKIINEIATGADNGNEQEDPEDIYGSLHRSFLRLKFQITIGLDASPFVAPRSRATSDQAPNSPDHSNNSQKTHTQSETITDQQERKSPNGELAWTLQGRRRQIDRLRMADEATIKKPAHSIREEDLRRSLTFAYVKLSQSMLSLMTGIQSKSSETPLHTLFLEVIEIIEDIYNRKKLLRPTFVALDFGVSSPLLFIMKWCMDVTIKRRAYCLLKDAPLREGFWYRDDIVAFVEQGRSL